MQKRACDERAIIGSRRLRMFFILTEKWGYQQSARLSWPSTAGGFPIGLVANFVIGVPAKALSLWLAVEKPNYADPAHSKPSRRLGRMVGRVGSVFLHSGISFWTRDILEDDQ